MGVLIGVVAIGVDEGGVQGSCTVGGDVLYFSLVSQYAIGLTSWSFYEVSSVLTVKEHSSKL